MSTKTVPGFKSGLNGATNQGNLNTEFPKNMNFGLPEKEIIIFILISVGGGVSLVIPVNGTRAQQLVATRSHYVVLLKWNHENATFENTTSSENVTVIASVETNRRLSGYRWNDGKAEAKGRLRAGE
jgi:hypothetical protein